MTVFESLKKSEYKNKVVSDVLEKKAASHKGNVFLNRIYLLEQENKELLNQIGKLEFQLNHDYLTQLKSREAAISAIDNSLKNSSIFNIAIVFMDIDNLKAINDYGGHSLGDKVLKQFASTLLLIEKPEQCISRLGGDEFIAILPNCTKAQVDEWCSLLDKKLAQSEPFTFDDKKTRVSVSTGYYLHEKNADNLAVTSNDLIRLADLSMYRSKLKNRHASRLAYQLIR